MKVYRYYCLAESPAAGTVPPGAIREESADEDGYIVDEEGHVIEAWGFVEYDRELTEEEMDGYCLERG